MKKLLLSIFAISLYFIASAQTTSTSNYQDRWQYYFNLYDSYTSGVANLSIYGYLEQNKDVKSLKQTAYKYKNGKRVKTPYYSIESIFDDGLLTDYKSYKNEVLQQEYRYNYNSDGYYTNYKYLKKGKLIREEKREYNDSNKVLKFENFKNDKLKSNYVVQYMNYTKIVKKDNFRKDNTEPYYTWIYDYYADGKKKMSEYYKNGKLKRRYLYTCDDEGEEVKDTVKTSKICYITEYNADSSYVKIFRNTDSKGKIRKQRYTYNKNNKLLSYESINAKGITTYKYSYEYDNNGNKINYAYYKKSKLFLKQDFKYNANNKLVETIMYNGKLKYLNKTTQKRDEKDRIIEICNYNSKNNIVTKTQYQYDEKGNKTRKIVYKKEAIKTEYNYIYNYIKKS